MLLSEVWEGYEMDKRFQGYSGKTLSGYSLQMRLFIDKVGNGCYISKEVS